MATVTNRVIPQSIAKALLVAAGTSVCTLVASGNPAQATILTFFGEDLGSGETTRLTTTPNADDARNRFASNLVGEGIETFESFANNTPAPLSITFPGVGTATLTGNGSITSVPTGTNGIGSYPISGDNFYEASSSFAIQFNNPVAAFGFYGTDIGDFDGQVTLTLANGANSLLTIPNSTGIEGGSALYYGIIATNPSETFTGVTFDNTASGTDVFGFDNMTIGSLSQVQPTPVPFEFSPGLGILALGAWGAMAQLNSKVQKWKFSGSRFSNN